MDWDRLDDLQLGVGHVLLEHSVDALAVECVVEVLVDIMFVEELREDLLHELPTHFPILEVAHQVIIREACGFVLLDERFHKGHQPYPLV